MLLNEMYNKLEELGGFSTKIEDLNDEQLDFLNDNNEYNIELEDLLDIIDNYSYSNYAEINGLYKDLEELAEETIKSYYDIDENLLYYIDLEKFGSDLLNDEFYYELSNGEIAYICM